MPFTPKPMRRKFHEVNLPDDAVWHLRPATSIDIDMARARTQAQLAGLMAGSDAAAALVGTFGPLLEIEDTLSEERLTAVTAFLADAQLALICSGGWSDVVGENGEPLPAPTLGLIGLIMIRPDLARKVRGVLYATLQDEVAEKKELAVSPTGAGGAADPIAPDAALAANHVRAAAAAITGDAAPNPSMPR